VEIDVTARSLVASESRRRRELDRLSRRWAWSSSSVGARESVFSSRRRAARRAESRSMTWLGSRTRRTWLRRAKRIDWLIHQVA
jgi:hypothetical protein